MKYPLRWSLLLGVLLLLAANLYYSRQPYQPPGAAETQLRVNYLARVIGEGAAPGTDLGRLTAENPEWGLFTLSFSTYALANLAARQPARRPEVARLMQRAIAVALRDSIRQPFADSGLDSCAGYSLPRSVLYLGHLNLMLGCLRQLNPASPYQALHDSLSASLFRRYQSATAGNLASYPGLRWLPDNTVALASLALHGRLTGSGYDAAGRRWVARARQEWLHDETHLLASQVDAGGRVAEGPRGSMLGWSIWFLAPVDSALAGEQYRRFRAAASTSLGALQLYREEPGRYETGAGDVDSGPLVLGYGIPATTFAYADAVALGDWPTAARLRRVISLGSREVRTGKELRYEVRLFNLNVNPLSEALLLWADVPGARWPSSAPAAQAPAPR